MGFEPPWIIRDVPTVLALHFVEANRVLSELVDQIHAAAGYDTEHARLVECCPEWQGKPWKSDSNGRIYYEDCRRCGWLHKDHEANG